MDFISNLLGVPLGYLMYFCQWVFSDYGLAIIFFTLLTKVVMFPISLWVQNNSIKMVRMKPRLDALKYQYVDDKDAYYEAQAKLYKEEKYSAMASVWPLDHDDKQNHRNRGGVADLKSCTAVVTQMVHDGMTRVVDGGVAAECVNDAAKAEGAGD